MKKRILGVFLVTAMCLGVAGVALAENQEQQPEQEIVHVGTPDELSKMLHTKKSNLMVMLDGKDYTVQNYLQLTELQNVTIQGTNGTRIVSPSESDTVLYIQECKGLTLNNLVLGHDLKSDERDCTEGVIQSGNSEVSINNCDIFGCGLYGISSRNSTITAKDTTIRDCAWNIMKVDRGTYSFTNCIFSGNGYKGPEDISGRLWDPHGNGIIVTGDGSDSELSFSRCIFMNNQNPGLIDCVEKPKKLKENFDNCIFYGNSWGKDNVTEPPVLPGMATEG